MSVLRTVCLKESGSPYVLLQKYGTVEKQESTPVGGFSHAERRGVEDVWWLCGCNWAGNGFSFFGFERGQSGAPICYWRPANNRTTLI